MDGTIIAESAWEVVNPEGESVEASDDKDSEIESDTEVETEDAGKSKKKWYNIIITTPRLRQMRINKLFIRIFYGNFNRYSMDSDKALSQRGF